ncbi:Gfo/Idh/MocA family protein [Roseibacillus ishigakijimensis]|uniref:Gfo/Idh/MocA family oxidoreductase n=1 Tax=Roseibacillus ishigakijimensis TaxID=454146 RepID=A0A934VHB5_9BACT|nr:Gfo/Idh/MocA family oxidoreductase [Roseibacillus ishigakijimensis]MBK1833763.1 Gfo/Idh/MocA family oxidoreductase [Roseibacillus ishigakijimensis]
MSKAIRVLCVGAGNMGKSHARAYAAIEGFEICGVVTRSEGSRQGLLEELGGGIAGFNDFYEALRETRPDAVSISTYPGTHAEYAIAAMEAGADVFVEKPLAETVEEAEAIVAKAQELGRKVVIGYILRVHPSWVKFIEVAQTLGKPLVMRMNLNQQSSGEAWETHKNLMASIPPVVDCGVHYVDVMCQMVRSRPVRVSGIGARLSDELPEGMVNYGQLQVTFEDGSVGWYEAGWGPMMSEMAFFVKDVVGPKGCVTIEAKDAGASGASANVDAHTKTESLRLHHSELGPDGKFVKEDDWIDTEDEPDHDELCKREQEYFLQAIQEDLDLSDHLADALNSMRIVLAADESFRTGKMVEL